MEDTSNLFEPDFIGREEEMERLEGIFDEIKEGDGTTVFISGEAGIGKTRLVDEFLQKVSKDKDVKIIQGRCFYESMGPLFPVKEAFRDSDLKYLISKDPPPKVLSTYLVDETGLLIDKAERGETDLDGDIFASMLETVKSFVKESLSEMGRVEGKGLNMIGYGNKNIIIQTGERFSLAAIIDGVKNEILIDDMDEKLSKAEKRLKSWEGDMSETEVVEEYVSYFTETDKYKGGYLVDDPEIKRENLFDNVLLGLRRLADQKSVIFFIDDLQWADPTTLSLLQYLSRNTKENRILIVGTYRPEDIVEDSEGDENPFKKTMQNMNRDGLFKEIVLKSLTWEDSEAIVHSLLEEANIRKDFLKKIYDKAEGNPFFILELIEFLIDEGYTVKKKDKWELDGKVESIDIPPRVIDVIERRLDKLNRDQRRILSCGSVEGEKFSTEVVGDVLDIERINLLEELNLMEKRYNLVDSQEEGYEFKHRTIRDVLYEDLSRQLRREYHRAIGEAYERISKKRIDDNLEVVAHHYHKAGDKRGIEYLINAAERSKERYANEEAISYYKDALSLMDEGHIEESKKAYRGLGDLYNIVGEYEKALENYESALEIADDTPHLYIKIADNFRDMGDYNKSLEYAGKGLDLASDDDELKSELLKGMGWTLIRQGDYEKAEDVLLNGKQLAEAVDVPNKKGNLYLACGALFYHKSEYDKSERHLKESIKIFKKIENLKQLSASYNNLALIYSARGEPEKSLEYHQKCLEMSKEIGRKRTTAVSLNNIGNLYLNLGRIQKGLEKHEKSLKIKEDIGDRFGIATSLNNIGDIYLTQGELDKALKHQERALDLGEEIGYKRGSSISLHNIGEIYFNKGDLDIALDNYQKSLEVDKDIGRKKGMAINYSRLAEVHVKKDDNEKAREYAQKALDISEKINSKEGIGMSKRSLGIVYREQEKWDDAVRMFKEGIDILKDSGNERDLAKIYFEYGVLLKQKEDRRIAKINLDKALDIFDEMGMKIWEKKTRKALEEF